MISHSSSACSSLPMALPSSFAIITTWANLPSIAAPRTTGALGSSGRTTSTSQTSANVRMRSLFVTWPPDMKMEVILWPAWLRVSRICLVWRAIDKSVAWYLRARSVNEADWWKNTETYQHLRTQNSRENYITNSSPTMTPRILGSAIGDLFPKANFSFSWCVKGNPLTVEVRIYMQVFR